MPNITFSVTSAVPARNILSALVDFTDKRLDIWRLIDPKIYKLHAQGDHTAEVTEGNNGIWLRERYDWSQEGVVRLEVLDSNIWQTGAIWEYRVSPAEAGGSRTDVSIHGSMKGFKGAIAGLFLSASKGKPFADSLKNTLARLSPEPAASS